MRVKEYSLREKKHARTKVAIMNSFISLMNSTRFEDISVKQVCGDVEVAEGTFFNYFPEKSDVLRYFLSLNTVRLIWEAEQTVPDGKCLPLIEALFARVSNEWSKNNLAYQIISVLLVESQRPKRMHVSDIEKKTAFPGLAGIEKVNSTMLEEWMNGVVVRAKNNGEIPSGINTEDMVVSLMSILSGTLLAIRFVKGDIGYHFMRQLHALWKSLGIKVKDKRG